MTEQKAITPGYKKIRAALSNEDTQNLFVSLLGPKAKSFLASVLAQAYADSNLQDCEPGTIISSAMRAAALSLPVDANIGQAYLVPYKGRGGKKCTLIVGYKGLIQLALRSKAYEILNVADIYEGQTVATDQLTGRISLQGEKKSDQVIGYVAYQKLWNGFEKAVYMDIPAIHEHAAEYAPSYKDSRSLWKTNPSVMEKKTVLRKLLGTYGVLTSDAQDQLAQEQQHELLMISDAIEAPEWVDKEDIAAAAQDLEPEPAVVTSSAPAPTTQVEDPLWKEPEQEPEGKNITDQFPRPAAKNDYVAFYNLSTKFIAKKDALEILKEFKSDAQAAYDWFIKSEYMSMPTGG